MSKALVIKGASFAENKVETITLTQPIPCTGLSVSPATVSFTELNATQQLTATKTPADTTDTVGYASSNENVATVSSSGLVTCVGVGSATITAMCGEQSATCTVTSTIVIDANTAYAVENGLRYSGSYEPQNGKDYAGISELARARLYYMSTNELDGYPAVIKQEYSYIYPIPIPDGTTKITVTVPTGLSDHFGYAVVDSQTKQKYIGGQDGNAAKCLGAEFYGTSFVIDISNMINADGFIFNPYTASGVDPSTITGDVIVTFSAE